MIKLLASLSVVALLGLGRIGSVEPVHAFACGNCWQCIGGHGASYFLGGDVEGLHSCLVGSGWPCTHPDCQSFALDENAKDFDAILAEVERGDVDAIDVLVRKYRPSVVWNRERRAIQLVTPCSGGFVAHIPVTDEQALALSSE